MPGFSRRTLLKGLLTGAAVAAVAPQSLLAAAEEYVIDPETGLYRPATLLENQEVIKHYWALDRRHVYQPAKWRLITRSHYSESCLVIYEPTGDHFTLTRPLFHEPYGELPIQYDEPVAIDATLHIPEFAREKGLCV